MCPKVVVSVPTKSQDKFTTVPVVATFVPAPDPHAGQFSRRDLPCAALIVRMIKSRCSAPPTAAVSA